MKCENLLPAGFCASPTSTLPPLAPCREPAAPRPLASATSRLSEAVVDADFAISKLRLAKVAGASMKEYSVAIRPRDRCLTECQTRKSDFASSTIRGERDLNRRQFRVFSEFITGLDVDR
jgi:hypothetical protein